MDLKSKLTFLVAVLLVTVAFGASAQTGQTSRAVYVEGDVTVFSRGEWLPVDIGTELPPEARLRLNGGAYVEINQGRSTIRFSTSGEYRLDGATEASGASRADTSDTDVRGLLGNKLRRLTRTRTLSGETAIAAGVRASEAATAPEITWAGDESSEELIDEGITLLAEGKTEDASFTFQDAYDFAIGSTADRAGFYLAYSLYILGDDTGSVEVLGEIDPAAEADYFPDYAILVGELYPGAGRTGEATETLQKLLVQRSELPDQDPLTAQAAFFLLGESIGVSDLPAARDAYRRATELAPGTVLADAARTAIRRLGE